MGLGRVRVEGLEVSLLVECGSFREDLDVILGRVCRIFFVVVEDLNIKFFYFILFCLGVLVCGEYWSLLRIILF